MKKFDKEKMMDLCAKDPNISLTDVAKEFAFSRERARQIYNLFFKEEERSRKFKNKKIEQITFISDLKLNNKKEDLFFIFLLNKKFKLKFNSKYGFLYKMPVKEEQSLEELFLRVKKNIEKLRLTKEDITDSISHVFEINKIDAGKMFEIFLKEGFFIKHKNLFFMNPKKSKFKYEIVEYLIARRKNDVFSFGKDTEKLIKDIRNEFSESFVDCNDYALGKLIASMISVSKHFSLSGKSEYTLNEVFENKVVDLSDIEKFIDSAVKEKNIYSLQEYWARNKEHIEARGIESLQELYSLLREKNNKEYLSFLRYPSVFKAEYNEELNKGSTIKDIYLKNKPNNLTSLKELQDYFGLSNISARQFFLK